jgi:multiple antibiotic resistance protein
MELFFLVVTSVFSVMNPLGTVPVFVGLTQSETKKERNKTSLFTAINAFVILLISFFIGHYILLFFGISLDSLKIAGGLIIASSGFALLTGSFNKHKGMEESTIKSEMKTRQSVSLTPLAIPMLAGPGTISLLISLQKQHTQFQEQLIIIGAIFIVCLLTYFLLKESHYIVKLLGASGLNAISRIIGFIVIAIGIEYISSSVIKIVASLLH